MNKFIKESIISKYGISSYYSISNKMFSNEKIIGYIIFRILEIVIKDIITINNIKNIKNIVYDRNFIIL